MGQGTEGRTQQQFSSNSSTARQGRFQGYSMASRIPRQEKDESS